MIKQYHIKGVTQDWLLKPGMVVYVEREYDKLVNQTICISYKDICHMCKIQELTFLYIPEFYKSCGLEVIEYMTGKNLEYPSSDCTGNVLNSLLSPSVLGQINGPSLLFSGMKDGKLIAYQIATPDKKNMNGAVHEFVSKGIIEILLHTFRSYRNPIEKQLFIDSESSFCKKNTDDRVSDDNSIRFRCVPNKRLHEYYSAGIDKEGVCYRRKRELSPCIVTEEAPRPTDEIDPEIEEIKNSYTFNVAQAMIRSLLNKGYSKETIWALFEPIQELSPIHISKDYRITLTLYKKEIVLTPLLKAVYLFFLKHPQGVYFKDLPSHHAELLQLYRTFAVRGTAEKHFNIITDLVNPLGNSMNEKCSIIKKYMTNLLDDSLAKYYYISGGKGEMKRIAIKPEMIIWE